MGGAAQYISIADMIVFEEIEFDDEAVGAREVEGKKKGRTLMTTEMCLFTDQR